MKSKLLNALLIISSLFGYLEWGKDNHSFLYEIEAKILIKIFHEPESVLHPFTVLPLLGQILLLFTLLQKRPNRILTFIGIASIGMLLLLMFAIGCMSLNFKILFSTVPFLVLAYFTVRHYLKTKQE
jgi:hypothetical protein